jgi:ATP-binding cassette subfamily B protein
VLAELDGHADKIVALDNVRLVEEGSAQKLLAKGGLFARLYSIQRESLGCQSASGG